MEGLKARREREKRETDVKRKGRKEQKRKLYEGREKKYGIEVTEESK